MNHSLRRSRLSYAAAAAAGLVAVGAGPAPNAEAAGASVHRWGAPLTDLQPGMADPLDSARGRLLMVSHHGATTAVFSLSGVGPAAVGHTYGAHLHTGPCVAGDGAAAGPHYNDSRERGAVLPVVGPSTEVWLDVTIGVDGWAVAVAHVPFVPRAGERSVVVHAEPTDDHGSAGPRLACLPVSWS
ncbi:MAG: hypothetical protein ABJA89_05650 [Lapillicoccus sp.]